MTPTPDPIISPEGHESVQTTVVTLLEMADRLRINPQTLVRIIKERDWPGVFFIGPKVWSYRIHVEEFVDALKKAGHKYADR